jgi:DNA-directed RNA polymerase specialized sigma24 family protein
MESIRTIHDRSLVSEAQGGEDAAFAELVHAHDEAVLRLTLRITGSQSDAQDIY